MCAVRELDLGVVVQRCDGRVIASHGVKLPHIGKPDLEPSLCGAI